MDANCSIPYLSAVARDRRVSLCRLPFIRDIEASSDNRYYKFTTHTVGLDEVKALYNYNVSTLYIYLVTNTVETFVINEGIESIVNGAFAGDTDLVNLYLPTTLRNIETNAFTGMTSLKNIIIRSYLEEIEDNAFGDTSDRAFEFTLHGYESISYDDYAQESVAEQFAAENGIPYSVISNESLFMVEELGGFEVKITGIITGEQTRYGSIIRIPELIIRCKSATTLSISSRVRLITRDS